VNVTYFIYRLYLPQKILNKNNSGSSKHNWSGLHQFRLRDRKSTPTNSAYF